MSHSPDDRTLLSRLWAGPDLGVIDALEDRLRASRRGRIPMQILLALRAAWVENRRLRQQVEELQRLHALTSHGHHWFPLTRPPYGPFGSDAPDRPITLYVLTENRAVAICDLGPGDSLVVGRAPAPDLPTD